jgi:hypothetical protein
MILVFCDNLLLPLFALSDGQPPRSAVAVLVYGPAAGVLLATEVGIGDPPPGLTA